MAGKGGYQRPAESASYSGVGKNSRRTDGGSQAVRSPNVQDSTELTQGDRQRIEQGQRVAPLSSAPAPQVQAPAPGASPSSGAGGSVALPPHLFGGESSRPDEPITEGLPFGPGAGPDALTQPPPQDNRELMLHFLATTLGNEDAANMLNDYRNERTQPDMAPMVAAPEQAAMEDPIEEEAVGMEDDLFLPDEDLEDLPDDADLATEEDVAVEGEEATAEPSVETPEAAASAPPAGEGE